MSSRTALAFYSCLATLPLLLSPLRGQAPQSVFGYTDFGPESKVEEKFLAVPDAKEAGEELEAAHLRSSSRRHT